jgi:hypothetical protein
MERISTTNGAFFGGSVGNIALGGILSDFKLENE